MRMSASWFGSWTHRIQGRGAIDPRPESGLPSDRHPTAPSVPSCSKLSRCGPTGIIDKLNKEINAGLADSKIKERIADLGATVLVNSPADFGKLIAEDTEKWGKVVKFARIKADQNRRQCGLPQTPCCTAPCFFAPRPEWVRL
jgi:Tripartite tricarboxylate transporter family receptor